MSRMRLLTALRMDFILQAHHKGLQGKSKATGQAAFEIGCDQGRQVSEMMQFAGFSDVHVIKDLAGNDRVVSGVFDSKEEKHV